MSENEQPAPPSPVVRNAPVEIADGVFVIPDDRVPLVPNVGFVRGERSLLVVDTGLGPRSGESVLEHARALAAGRRLLLTLTHFHPEHGFGAHAFAGEATIVYNAAQRDELRRKGPGYLEMFKTFGEAVAEEVEGVVLVDPDVVYDGTSAELDLGGRSVRLLTWGRAHTGGDQVAFVPDEGVVFGGDLFETRMFPIVPWFPPDDTDVDGGRWIDVLGHVLELAPDVVVPGHGEVTDVSLVRDVRDYLGWVRDEAGRRRQAGASADEAAAAIEPLALERWSTWENPEWIGFAVRCFHGQA
jgi:glyoxylase-like metal-dependent hydrolase (beta-lactamase superfamily II)